MRRLSTIIQLRQLRTLYSYILLANNKQAKIRNHKTPQFFKKTNTSVSTLLSSTFLSSPILSSNQTLYNQMTGIRSLVRGHDSKLFNMKRNSRLLESRNSHWLECNQRAHNQTWLPSASSQHLKFKFKSNWRIYRSAFYFLGKWSHIVRKQSAVLTKFWVAGLSSYSGFDYMYKNPDSSVVKTLGHLSSILGETKIYQFTRPADVPLHVMQPEASESVSFIKILDPADTVTLQDISIFLSHVTWLYLSGNLPNIANKKLSNLSLTNKAGSLAEVETALSLSIYTNFLVNSNFKLGQLAGFLYDKDYNDQLSSDLTRNWHSSPFFSSRSKTNILINSAVTSVKLSAVHSGEQHLPFQSYQFSQIGTQFQLLNNYRLTRLFGLNIIKNLVGFSSANRSAISNLSPSRLANISIRSSLEIYKDSRITFKLVHTGNIEYDFSPIYVTISLLLIT